MRTLVAALAVGAAAQAPGRTKVSIDLGWRFFLGANAGGQCTTDYPVNMNNIQCNGLTNATADGGSSASACEAAACAIDAAVWQFCPAGSSCGPQSCWVGAADQCTNPGNGWVSQAQNSTQPWLPPAANPTFDDSTWTVVDIPHDTEIEGTYTESANGGEGFLPMNVSYYRKHLNIPAAWAGSHIEVYIEGALSVSTWWLNGVPILTNHFCGYTPITLRIDNVTGAPLNFGGDNVLVAYISGLQTTGWWYEGSGLVRRAYITSVFPDAYIATHGIWSPHYVEGSYHARATPAAGVYADTAYVNVAADISNDGAHGDTQATVAFSLVAADGVTVVATTTTNAAVNASTTRKVEPNPLVVTNVELWSLPRPYLYTLVTTVSVAGVGAVDTINTTLGLRSIAWDPESGLKLNEQSVKMRGFCNHESFAGVGAAIPERVDLLRVQQMRGVGGNAWRTSHNPPEPVLLELTDRLGIAVLDENRVFATVENCPGCSGVPTYSGNQVDDMATLVARDRNKASVIWWSFCNEAGCGNGASEPALDFKLASYANDGSRAVGANMGWISPITPSNMSDVLDVMGFSHASYGSVLAFHQAEPEKPLVMTECCSCETQRGEDSDLQKEWNPTVYFSNENSGCVRDQTQTSNGVEWMGGTFVWTLHDYFGEPGKWPHISSSFGSYDLAGIPKAPVYWYRSWWLANISAADAGRPPVPNTDVFVRIVESWQPPVAGATGRNINVYTNAPAAQLIVNGAAFGAPVAVQPYTAAAFTNVPFAPGTITAQALDGSGAVLASHNRSSWGAPASIVLTLDAPNPAQGMGGAVYLDGRDVALVRATIVDAAGNVCHDATTNVTFAVTAGPGLVWGVGNGDPASHDPNHAPWRPAYHGVVRGIVRVTVDAAGTPEYRALEAQVNPDAGAGPWSSSVLVSGTPATALTIAASAPGLPVATVTVALSVDPADSVMAVAAASVASAFIGE